MHFGGALPGPATIAPELCEHRRVGVTYQPWQRLKEGWYSPAGFHPNQSKCWARGGDNGAVLTLLEQELKVDVKTVNVASASPSFQDLMAASTRGRHRQRLMQIVT